MFSLSLATEEAMGKGELSSMIAAGDRRRPLSVLQIFQEAARLLWMSRKPVLSIFLLVLLPYALLNLSNYLVITPLNAEMTADLVIMGTKDPRSPEYHELLAAVLKDLRELTIAAVAMMLVSFLLSAFLLMAVVHTVAMAAKGEQVTLRDLLCRIRRAWKGPVITKLYVAIISFSCTLLILLIPFGGFAFIINSKGSILWLPGGVTAVISILASLLLVYLQMVWCQGLVISVVEEDCYGFAALGRASELIQGRRKLALVVNFLLQLISLIISVTYYFVSTGVPAGKTANIVARLALSIVVVLPMAVFTYAVYVVFYYECKKGHGEEVAVKGSLVYTRVPTAPSVDEALP